MEKTSFSADLDPQPPSGDPSEFQHCTEAEVQKAIAWFAEYLRCEREEYYPIGKPLRGKWRELMHGYFEPELLERVRILELVDQRIANPWFYPQARERGFHHLPDITHKAAVTFLDVVVFNEKVASRDLFHGLVHAAQAKVLGTAEFTQLFVRGFLRARSYFLAPMKAHAFALDARFAAHPGVRFSVEPEIRQWWQAGKY
ncbi:MAG TPA: hypothetical protein VM781_01630 [Candidatus Bathyarchaeia archaeon]|nr:hypothetical protein [Candidatus Bathyarchaeia archaeon]